MPLPLIAIVLGLAVGGVALAVVAGGKKRVTPDVPDDAEKKEGELDGGYATQPSNMLVLAYDVAGAMPGSIQADAVPTATFPKSVGISGYGFRATDRVRAFNAVSAAAWAKPDTVFLYYDDLVLARHEVDEVAVLHARFGDVLTERIFKAGDFAALGAALEVVPEA